MLLLAMLACDRELATLREPRATWTHVKEFHGGGRMGGIAEYGLLEVAGYPNHRTSCWIDGEALEAGEGWIAYRCGEVWSTLHLGPSRLLEDCSSERPPAPLDERWLPVLGCEHNDASEVLEQAEEAGVTESLMLGALDLELVSRWETDEWIDAWERLPPEPQAALEPHLRQAFERPTSPARLLRALRILDPEGGAEDLLARGHEILPQTGESRDQALALVLERTRGAEGNSALACASLDGELTPGDTTALWLLAEAAHPCSVPEQEICSLELGCDGVLCTPEQLRARATEVLDGERSDGSVNLAWAAHHHVTVGLPDEVLLRNARLFYTVDPASPSCSAVSEPGQACACPQQGQVPAKALCDMDGTEALAQTYCRVVVDDAAQTLTGWHICTEQGGFTTHRGSGTCCEGLELVDSACVATLATFQAHLEALPAAPAPQPEALAALRAEVTLPPDLDALLARQDGLQRGQTRIRGAEEILVRSRGAGALVIGVHGDAELHYESDGVFLRPPDPGGNRRLGYGLDEAFLELGVWPDGK